MIKKRLKILEKKMSGFEVREFLKSHKRYSLAQPKDLQENNSEEFFWVGVCTKIVDCVHGVSYAPSTKQSYECNLLFKNKVAILIDEPFWFYWLRKKLGL